MSEQNQATQEEQEVVFQIQRIYVKDVSFEAPNLPNIFQQEWKPQLSFELNTETREVGENLYEVALHINVSVTLEDSNDTAFICEVKQAGVFTVSGLDEINLAHALAVTAPEILYPYARELIASLVNRGTFPALNLSPVNFDALFADYLKRQQEEAPAQVQ